MALCEKYISLTAIPAEHLSLLESIDNILIEVKILVIVFLFVFLRSSCNKNVAYYLNVELKKIGQQIQKQIEESLGILCGKMGNKWRNYRTILFKSLENYLISYGISADYA